ncbi:MAG: fibronectin type III domain-containing protein [Ignavibacteria bacterium]|nr:fibronectin type III domain-containing protein [Ignavibacteria bacterium]
MNRIMFLFAALIVFSTAVFNPGQSIAQTNIFPSYYEDFENGDGGWNVTGSNASWQLGYPSAGDIYSTASGSYSWVTNLYGPYNANETSYLESPVFDMSCFASDPYIGFSHVYFLEDNYDFHWLEISIDGGAWTQVGSSSSGGSGWYQPWYDGNTGNTYDVWGGYYYYNGGWEYAEHILSGAAGSNNVRLRFVMQSDGYVEYEGVGIDDIQIFLPGANINPPSLSNPADNAVNVLTAPTLTWQTAACADNYRLQVSTSPTFAGTIFNQIIVGTSQNITGLGFSTTYYWRVNSNKDAMTSSWSPVYTFTTVAPPPTVPTHQIPANGAIGIATMYSSVQWNASPGATLYRVQVSTDNTFTTTLIDNSSAASFAVLPTLPNFTTYYWRVNASNISGTSAWSSPWSFRTVLAPAVLTLPNDNEVSLSLPTTLVWQSVQGIDIYQIQIATDENFTQIIEDVSNIQQSRYQANNLTNNVVYYWRVKLFAPDGEPSNWSSVRKFTTIIASPVLALPYDGIQDLSKSTMLSWSAVSGDVQYRLQVSTDMSFIKNIMIDMMTPSISTVVSGLAGNTIYYWRVQAGSPTAGTSGWSSIRSFSTVVDATVAELPLDNANSLVFPITMQWASRGDKVQYDLQIATDAGFKTVIADIARLTGVSTEVGLYDGLQYNTTYFWRVRPLSNTNVTINWSPVRSFRTAIAKTALQTPANYSGNQPKNTQLTWKVSSGAMTYRVQVSTEKSFVTTVADQAGVVNPNYTVSDLGTNQTYFWRVMAESTDNGVGSWSDIWQFSTGEAAAATPMLQTPVNNKKNQLPVIDFTWETAVNAISYRLQISKEMSFASTVLDKSNLVVTSFNSSGLQPNTTYYWRVSASNTVGESPWSEVWNFTLVPTAPAMPSLFSPADRAINQSRSTLLKWTAPSNGGAVEKYQIQVSEMMDFSTLVANETVSTATAFSLTNLKYKTVYYWRVSADNAGGNTWSETWSFTTEESSAVDEPSTGEFAMQLFPNPTQHTASIQFAVGENSSASLVITNAVGIPVYSSTSVGLSADDHTVLWLANEVASGVYFVRLTINGISQNATVTVVK